MATYEEQISDRLWIRKDKVCLVSVQKFILTLLSIRVPRELIVPINERLILIRDPEQVQCAVFDEGRIEKWLEGSEVALIVVDSSAVDEVRYW